MSTVYEDLVIEMYVILIFTDFLYWTPEENNVTEIRRKQLRKLISIVAYMSNSSLYPNS